jgi:hypothetical protein
MYTRSLTVPEGLWTTRPVGAGWSTTSRPNCYAAQSRSNCFIRHSEGFDVMAFGRLRPGSTRIAAIAVVLSIALAGCTSTVAGSGGPGGSVPPSTTASPSPSGSSTASGSAAPSTPAGSSSAFGATLESIAIKTSDLNTGYSTKLYDGGDQVVGQVTLDNCGYTFTSEAHRVARRQYGIVDSSGQDTGGSNELVAYDSSASAALALTEWVASATTCPKTPVKSSVGGVPDLTMVVTTNQRANPSLPIPTNAVTVESATADGETDYLVTILQVKGRYLDALYANGSATPSSDELDGLLALASITGARLKAAN